jgi:dipeptidyl aminopeptidase/acylaminoacyl peptidase
MYRQRIFLAIAGVTSLLLLLSYLLGSADGAPLIDRKLFFGYPKICRATISPDGKKIAFLKPHLGTLNIWVTERESALETAHPITTATQRPIIQYFWSRDSKHLLYLQDEKGNENFHLFAVDVQDASVRDLTPFDTVDANLLNLPKNDPTSIYLGLNHRDQRFFDVYKIDIPTGNRTLILQNDNDVYDWIFDCTGNLRLAARYDETGGIQLCKIGKNGLIPIWNCTNEETCIPFQFHIDGKRLYAGTNRGKDVNLQHLVLIDAESGIEEVVEADPEQSVDIEYPLFCPVTDQLIGTAYVGDRLRIYFSDETWKREYENLKNQIQDAELAFESSSLDGRFWIVHAKSDVDPLRVYLYDRATSQIKFLYRSQPELKKEFLSKMVPVSYQTRDGLTIHGYLTLPIGSKGKNLPVIVLPHGGPYSRNVWGYHPEVQLLANRGYAVFQMNFRGSTGYGKQFFAAGKQQWGDTMQNDITDGVSYLIQQNIADPHKVAIYGGSYGGYAALAGLAFTPELYAAGVSFVGPSNLLTLLASLPPQWHTGRQFQEEYIGRLDNPNDVVRLRRQSPLFSANKIVAPLLVVQGANDPRVKKQESEQIVKALYSAGHQVEYLLAHDEGHGFANETNRLAFSVALEFFLAKHLGGRYQKDVPPEIAQRLEDMRVDPTTLFDKP